MPPSYGTKDYWDARFQHEDNYEWLLPADSLNSVVREALSSRHRNQGADGGGGAPKILHIGCGSSDLSFRLRELVASPRQVTNVDYAEVAVQKCRRREAAALEGSGGGGDLGMRWETADLLDAESIARLGRRCQSPSADGEDGNGPFYFDVVADKSTCDAISIAEDVPVPLPFASPRNMSLQQTDNGDEDGAGAAKPKTTELVEPLLLLAVHMAVLTPPRTGRWCAISYSHDRFSFLDGRAGDEEGFPDPRRFWRVVRRERVTVAPPAATGSGGHVVHRPEIAYWLWVLGRTGEMVEG
ncbi:hypothetical protein PG993_000326 [Apiospora rasikravindrae]|uniref:Methyltransferase domain-containing protein n=1 Tax=Apiospora rasikravindrae TaxID=990691 RepID=A0ABR1UB30_9PEZI